MFDAADKQLAPDTRKYSTSYKEAKKKNHIITGAKREQPPVKKAIIGLRNALVKYFFYIT